MGINSKIHSAVSTTVGAMTLILTTSVVTSCTVTPTDKSKLEKMKTAATAANLQYPASSTTLALNSPSSSPGNDTTPTIRVSRVYSEKVITLHTAGTCSLASQVGSATSASNVADITTSVLVPGTYIFYAGGLGSSGTECSTDSITYVLDTSTPGIPSALALQSPASSPASDSTPTIRVSGVTSGDVITLHTNSACTAGSLVATGTASGITIDLTSSALADGTHSFYAKATNGASTSSACSTATVSYVLDTVAPGVPSALTLNSPATTPNSDSTPTIAVAGVASGDIVTIYTSNTCAGAGLRGTATSAGASVNVTSSALTETDFTFYAKATDAVGNASACSTASVAYGYRVAASVPAGLAAVGSNQTVTLTWTASTGTATVGYKVYRSTTSGSGFVLAGTSSTNGFSEGSLTNGTTYYYVVAATNDLGDSANSSEVSVVPPIPPGAASGLTATNSASGTASLSWTAPATGTAPFTYKVYRSAVTTGPYTEIATTGAGVTTYNNTGLTNNATYYYVVAAVNNSGTGANSNEASVVVDYVPTLAYDFTAATFNKTHGSVSLTTGSIGWPPVRTHHGSDGKIRGAPHNRFLYSQDFSNGAWNPSSATRTATVATTAPDGTNTAYLIQATNAVLGGVLRQWHTPMSNAQYTISFYVKKINHRYIGLRISYSDTNAGVTDKNPFVDLDTCTGTVPAGISNGSVGCVADVNGWKRIWFTYYTEGTTSGYADLSIADATGATRTPAGTEQVYVWGAQVEENFSPSLYMPTTSAEVYNGPRFDYDPITLAYKGLLIEENRTNAVYYNERADTKQIFGMTVTENSTVAPDGAMTADTLTGTGPGHYLKTAALTGTAGSTYYRSLFIKKTAAATIFPAIVVQYTDNADTNLQFSGVVLNTNTGVAYANSGWGTASTVTEIVVKDAGSYWRVGFKSTAPTGTTRIYVHTYPSVNTTGTDGTNSSATSAAHVVWGDVLEVGEFMTSYIANHYWFTVTRPNDHYSVATGAWYNSSAGSLRVEAATYQTFSNAGAAALSDNTYDNKMDMRVVYNNTKSGFFRDLAPSGLASYGDYNGVVVDTSYKLIFSYDASDISCTRDGAAVQTSSGSLPGAAVNKMYMGALANGTGQLNGWIKSFRYYNSTMPSADLIRFSQ